MKKPKYVSISIKFIQEDISFLRYRTAHRSEALSVYVGSLATLMKYEGEPLPKDDLIFLVSEDYFVSQEKVRSCIDDLISKNILLTDENGSVYSDDVNEQVKKHNEKSDKCRKSVLARWEKDTNVIRTNNERNTNVIRTYNESTPNDMQLDTTTDTNVIRTQYGRNTDVIRKEKEKEAKEENEEKEKDIKEKEDKEEREDRVKENIYISAPVRQKKFVPPTVEEIQAYCEARHNDVDAKLFHDYYADGDWKDSQGSPVKNWKQKLLSMWEGKDWWKRSKEEKPGKHGYRPEDFADVPSGGSIW